MIDDVVYFPTCLMTTPRSNGFGEPVIGCHAAATISSALSRGPSWRRNDRGWGEASVVYKEHAHLPKLTNFPDLISSELNNKAYS